MWSSSPLRRYVDMVNQRQIIAMLHDIDAPYPKNDTALYAAMRDFDTMYGIYNEFQRNMERYWCLRWLEQEQANRDTLSPTLLRTPRLALHGQPTQAAGSMLPETPASSRVACEGANESLGELVVTATVLKENLVKMTEIPLAFRVPSLPEQLPAKTRVQIAIVAIDLLDLSLQTRYVATLAAEAGGETIVEEEALEVAEQVTGEIAGEGTKGEDTAC
jgi:exoribonuclease-2